MATGVGGVRLWVGEGVAGNDERVELTEHADGWAGFTARHHALESR